MLRNKLIAKKIRNIFILIMTIAIMLGAYNNVRRSRAEKVIEIALEIADKNNQLEKETVIVEATETSDGIYLLELPEIVNTKIINKYYTSASEEIESKTIQLTDKEISEKKVELETEYDTKEAEKVNVNGTTIETVENAEKKTVYNRKITNETGDIIATGYMPLDAQLDTKDVELGELTNVKIPNKNQSMKKAFTAIITEVKTNENNQAAMQSQSNVQDQATMQSQSDVQNQVSTQSQSDDEQNQVAMQQSQTEETKTVYNPSEYGQIVEIQAKYTAENKNEKITVYSLDEQNQLKELETTELETEEEGTEKTYQFPMNNEVGENEEKTYITTAELSEDATIGDETVNDETNIADSSTSYTTSDDTSNGGDFGESSTSPVVKPSVNAAVAGGTAESNATLMSTNGEKVATSGFFGNSSIQRQNIENVTFTDTLVYETPTHSYDASKNTGSSYDSGATTWKDLKGNLNGTLKGSPTWGTDSNNRQYLSLDGVNDWVSLGAYNPREQVKIDIEFTPREIKTGKDQEADIVSNFEDGGYGLYLSEGKPTFDIFNEDVGQWFSAKSSDVLVKDQKVHVVATFDGNNMYLYVDGVLKSKVETEGKIKLPDKDASKTQDTVLAIGENPKGTEGQGKKAKIDVYSLKLYDKVYYACSYDASEESTTYSNTTTIWKDLTGRYDGVVSGAKWGKNYITLDGVDDWVNFGVMDFSTSASLEAVISPESIKSGEMDILNNFEHRGIGITYS